MATFTKLSVSKKITNPKTKQSVLVYKMKKDGTKRISFAPVVLVDGVEKFITRTLFARLYDAESLAKAYLNR